MQGAIKVLSMKASPPASLFAVEVHDECAMTAQWGLELSWLGVLLVGNDPSGNMSWWGIIRVGVV